LKLLEGGRRRRRKENSCTLNGDFFFYDGSSLQLFHDCCTIPLVYGAAQCPHHNCFVSQSVHQANFFSLTKAIFFDQEILGKQFSSQIQLIFAKFLDKKETLHFRSRAQNFFNLKKIKKQTATNSPMVSFLNPLLVICILS
jgi:hypothetical protein